MQIIEKSITEIKPYEKNPRKNDEAVEYVANSIKEFGFKAAQELGLEKLPCIIADDLTDEQVKAFRLADNKVGEVAEWDFDLLNSELDDIFDIDMLWFGFDNNSPEPPADIKTVELKPYKKVHYLITLDVNDNDKVIEIISQLRQMEGIEVESTLN